jgi:anhydro-N-acetylmuramic acid kinase
MAGTSLDGIDACLVDFSDGQAKTIGFYYSPYDTTLIQRIAELSLPEHRTGLQDYGILDCELGHLFAASVRSLLQKTSISAASIQAIGSHGQTVFHAPDLTFPFSLQIADPNVIAEQTGITTIADFRRRDMAVNGQGAPLVPAFHEALFSHPTEHRCIINIGGIANITVLPAGSAQGALGFDTGPGNTLMDLWIQQQKNLAYDAGGQWAKTGSVDHDLIGRLKLDPYFKRYPPKSTGKEYFSLSWLQKKCGSTSYKPEDIQASLVFLTAITLCDAIRQYAPLTERVLICGGGAQNDYLRQLITKNLDCPVESTLTYGIHPDHVEAAAFAWLARRTLNHLPGNQTSVTGASRPVILGGVYFAR